MLYIESSLFWPVSKTNFLIDIFKNILIEKIRKIGTFFKGYSRWFCSKFLKFLYFFFLDQTGQENVFVFWIWVTQWFWVKMFTLNRNIQEIILSYVLGRPWNRASRSVLRSLMLAGILIFWDFFQRCLAYSVGSNCQPFIYVCLWSNQEKSRKMLLK